MIWFKNINKICAEHQEELLKKKGVQGIGIGTKIRNGKDTGKKAIVVFVERKKDLPELMAEDVIPQKIEGFLTDVIDIGGEIKPVFRQKHRPVKGGISGMVEGGTACSIGLVVFKDGNPYILTNEHCVHYQKNNIGKKFLQPSPADGGKLTDAIGVINMPPRIRNDQQNKIDSNIIPLDVDYELKVQGLEDYKKQWVKPQIGLPFAKVGRTTGITKGVISHINAIARVNYGGSLGVCEFYPCIFALQNNYDIVNGGDSGSCIFSSEGVVGQTFAAAPNLAIFLTGEVVGQALGISLKKPLTGFIALGSWLSFNKLEIILNANVNLREKAGLNEKIIKVLPKGTKVKAQEEVYLVDEFIWIRVEQSS